VRRIIGFLSIAFTCIFSNVQPAFPSELTLSAAASLREAVDELTARFSGRMPGVTFRKNFGASGTLAKQIEQGAPVDIFISANPEWVEYLRGRKLLEPSSIDTFAHNELVFAGITAVPVSGMRDLPKLRKIAIGSPKSVPAGEYAMASFRAAGLEKALEGKLVMARDVRDAMKYAELGEVDGALVYRTDALLLGKRSKILFTVPAGLHDRVTYPMALTVTGAGNRDAVKFLRFLHSAEARMVLEKFGFAMK